MLMAPTATPASSGDPPITPWISGGTYAVRPNITTPASVPTARPAVTTGRRSSSLEISGSGAPASERPKSARRATAPTAEPITSGEVQPTWTPNEGASRSSETPSVSVRLPIQLSRCWRRSTCSCRTVAISTAATRPTGTLR